MNEPDATTGPGTARRPSGRHLTYIIGTYPVLTTTFIDREIVTLRRLGFEIRIISIRRPDAPISDTQQRLQRDVRYILPVSPLHLVGAHVRFALTRPGRYFRVLGYLLSRPHRTIRERAKTLLHFGEAVVIADVVRSGPATSQIHAHFVDRAATVAMVVARLVDLPYSATAHASEIYVDPVLLPEKISNASFVSTCTQYNADHLADVGGTHGDHVVRIYHGLDAAAYRPVDRHPDPVPLILSVGQLKERKGLRYLVEACALLQARGVPFRCQIVGEGPLRDALRSQIDDLELTDRVELVGAIPHDAVVARYQEATVFVLPAVKGSDGDRDGIPNVILEAMAMALPVVSTDHSGIPEAVTDGVTGRLVHPGDPQALADALAQVITDHSTARAWGEEGRRQVLDQFDVESNVALLGDRFLQSMTQG